MNKYSLLLLLFFPISLFAQVSGVIRDERKAAIGFATVYVKNTSIGTVANDKGFFQLQVPKGEQEIVFQYLGYKEQVVKVQVADKPIKLSVQMEPSDLELGEVVITTDDPAIRIMKAAIAKRSYYKNKLKDYACDAYIKGLYRLSDAPEKVMGVKVGDMDGMLDSSRSGILYFSESVSQLYVQGDPLRKKEVMISSKVSGSENGYSMNRATLTDFNLYDERLDIDREILSPLADNAFNYYNFKYIGKYRNLYGYEVYKIKVIPKRAADPTFGGFLYIVDDYYNLAEVDLYLTGDAMKQPILDTMRIQQSFIPVKLPDSWALLTQVTSFKFGLFGFKIGGFFNGVFSNYNFDPAFTHDFFNREEFKVEADAGKKDLSYWNEVRPVPLTEEEQHDYVKKDSLSKIWNSKAYMDSMDRKSNKFKLANLLFGYSWENSWKKRSVSYPAVYKWVQFNTVQGWLLDFSPDMEIKKGETRDFLRMKGNLNYGFSEEKLRGGLEYEQQFESISYKKLKIAAGIKTAQFNGQNPIGPLLNSLYSLFREENYLKLYEKTYFQANWSQTLSPVFSFQAAAAWEDRKRLSNHSNYTWDKYIERKYTSNEAATGADALGFPSAATLELNLKIRFKQTYTSYPQYRQYTPSDLPEIGLRYRKAIPGIAGSEANYDFVRLDLSQDALSWGLAGYSEWSLAAGAFLSHKTMGFMDYYHPSGNQTWFANLNGYTGSFFQMPYYGMGTNRAYVEAHWQHHLQGFLLDKIPGLRRLNWKEVFGANVYYTQHPFLENGDKATPYWECNVGLSNLGIKAIRVLRVDFTAAFQGGTYLGPGLMIGVGL